MAGCQTRRAGRRLRHLLLARPDHDRPGLPATTELRPVRYAWLILVKDLLQASIWLLAFLGNRIEWRGQRLRLRRDGTLERLSRPVA